MSTEQIWRERIDRCCNSGSSIAGFCRNNNISLSSMYYWRKQLGEVRNPDFIPVEVRSADFGKPVLQFRIGSDWQISFELNLSLRWP